MWPYLIIFAAGFVTAALVAYLFRVRGMRLIRDLQTEREALLGEESRIFTFLHEIGESLSHDQSLRALHDEIVRGVSRVVDADGGALYLLDPRLGTHLVPASLMEAAAPLIDLPADMAAQPAGKALHSFLQMKAVPREDGILGKCFEAQGPIHFGPLSQWHSLFRHLPHLLSYFRHRITNATSEGFNSVIQALKYAARGFRSFANYRTRILFFCGKLDLKPDLPCH